MKKRKQTKPTRSKPISVQPLDPKEALSGLLQVRPERDDENGENGEQEADRPREKTDKEKPQSK